MCEPCMNGYFFYHSFVLGFLGIKTQREHLNRINVFPVADGDTGNNLVGTIRTVARRLESHRSASLVLNHIASLSLESARGNSGLIFSQYLNGLAIHTDGRSSLRVSEFASAAKKSVRMAYDAMEHPVEGTILTVLSAWSESLYENSRNGLSLDEVFGKALSTVRSVLKNTINQIEVLKKNKVLDAGAAGVVSFLEGMDLMRSQGPLSYSFRKTLNLNDTPDDIITASVRHEFQGDIPYRYCTEVLLSHPKISPEELKQSLSGLGDSLIVSRGKDKYRIHIHTNKPDKLVSILYGCGEIVQQKADDMIRQEQAVNSRLSETAVLTDSIADIPQEILDKYHIHVINLKLYWDGEEYIDRVTISPRQFYSWQQVRRSFPSSSLPDEKMIQKVYQFLLENYKNIIVLSVGKSLSGTCNQMKKTALKYNSEQTRIAVLDTCLNSVAQGLLVREVAIKAAEGKNLDELVSFAEELKKRIKIYVSVSTFKFMVKGGRISPLKGFVAWILGIKPIVSLDETGKGKALDKAVTRKQLINKITGIINTINKEKGIESYAIVHADAEADAREFSSLLQGILGKETEYISTISSIVGMHSGKGALAIAIVERKTTSSDKEFCQESRVYI